MYAYINPLNAELNPICHLLALLEPHHILHVSRIRVKIHVLAHIIISGSLAHLVRNILFLLSKDYIIICINFIIIYLCEGLREGTGH